MTDGDKKPEDFETEDFAAEDFSDDMSDMDFSDDVMGDDMGGNFDDGSDFAETPMDEGFTEGGADLSDEEWDTYDDDFAGEGEFSDTPAAAGKKKISNKMILGAAVVVGLGVFAVQIVGGGGAGTPMAPSTQAPPQPTPSENTDGAAPIQASSMTDVPESDVPKAFRIPYQERIDDLPVEEEQDATKPGMLNNPDELNEIETVGLDDGYEYEYVYEDEDGNLPEEDVDLFESDITEAPQEQAAQAPLTPIPSIDEDVEEITWGSEETTTPRMPGAQDVVKSEESSTASPFDSAAPEWDDEDVVTETESDDTNISSIGDTNIPVRATSSADNASLNALNSKLDTLLDRLETVESDLDKISGLERQIKDLASDVKALERKAPARSTTTSSAAPARNTAPVSSTPTRAATPKVERSAVKWTLKSAQPGQAMVAKQGSSDTISISTGQSLAGIGTVKSIEMQNGRWVVIGTTGRIEQ